MADQFILRRDDAAHYGSRPIHFLSGPGRSLTLAEAVDLCAHLVVLIADDAAIGKRVQQLSPEPVPATPMHLVPPAVPTEAAEQFDDSPAEDEETRTEEAAEEVADAVAEAKPAHKKHTAHRKRA